LLKGGGGGPGSDWVGAWLVVWRQFLPDGVTGFNGVFKGRGGGLKPSLEKKRGGWSLGGGGRRNREGLPVFSVAGGGHKRVFDG